MAARSNSVTRRPFASSLEPFGLRLAGLLLFDDCQVIRVAHSRRDFRFGRGRQVNDLDIASAPQKCEPVFMDRIENENLYHQITAQVSHIERTSFLPRRL